MEKINFVNNTTPALNATNLNKLQQNIEEELNEITPKFEYSTTETVVGTWIDNKPIYRKVISANNLTPIVGEDYLNITHGISNIDKVVGIKCIADTGDNVYFDFNNYTWKNNDVWNATKVFVDSLVISVIYDGANYINFISKAYFILEYTKTTD